MLLKEIEYLNVCFLIRLFAFWLIEIGTETVSKTHKHRVSRPFSFSYHNDTVTSQRKYVGVSSIMRVLYVPSTLKAMGSIIRLNNMRHMLQPLLISLYVILILILTRQHNMRNRNLCRIPDLDKGRTRLRTNHPFCTLGARQRNDFTAPAEAYRAPFFNAWIYLYRFRDDFGNQGQGFCTIRRAGEEGG